MLFRYAPCDLFYLQTVIGTDTMVTEVWTNQIQNPKKGSGDLKPVISHPLYYCSTCLNFIVINNQRS